MVYEAWRRNANRLIISDDIDVWRDIGRKTLATVNSISSFIEEQARMFFEVKRSQLRPN